MLTTLDKIVKIDSTGWFKNWFDSSFYHQLYANRDEKEAAGFIDALLEKLQPATGAQMLDLGCGNGRHCKYLAGKGFCVTGIDLASSSIRSAKKWETQQLQFHCQDMRMPFGKNCFDHVFSFFTSFGYFKTREEDDQVIRNIVSSLKHDGVLVMDYINSPHAANKLVPAETKEIDGVIYHITRRVDETHFFKKIVIEDIRPGKPFEYTEQVKKFSLDDFDQLFKRNGLKLQQVYGDYELNLYNRDSSPRMILIAEKI